MKTFKPSTMAGLASERSIPSFERAGRSVPTLKIRYRLPLLIGSLLVSLILASAWATYEGVQASALEVGQERLVHIADQIAGMLQEATATLTARVLAAANESAIREYLRNPTPVNEHSAVAILEQFTLPRDANSVKTEIWKANGALVLSFPEYSLTSDLSEEFKKSQTEPYQVIGAFRIINGKVIYPAVAAIRENGKSVGYLVDWRNFPAGAERGKRLTELLGNDATLYLGNAEGDIWTNLTDVVEKPPAGLESTTTVTNYERDGQSVMALGRAVGGTPWFVVVEFSHEAVVKPASRFLGRMVIIGSVLLLIGVAISFAMSRSITDPLDSLTIVASQISKGDYSRKVHVRSQDEFGVLANTFNTMIERIRLSQHELEQKVRERTYELEAANRQLELTSKSHSLRRTEAERARAEALDALRNTEEQLQQSQKLEAIGRLAGGISHDFNNLLTAITGYSDLAINRLSEEDPVRRFLAEIRKASERAAALTRQLLAFSRKQVLQPKVLDLNAVISDLERMLRRMIGEDIDLRTNLDPRLDTVKADPGQIEQVIMNLVVNAKDAMPCGGKVTIETANVLLDQAYAEKHLAVNPGRYVMIAVSDTGSGMDTETQARIFEPFFTTKEKGKGTGLGLSMVYGIVKQSGGNIWVYSELQHGTTFKIYLPAADEAADQPFQSDPEPGNNNASETVLLVEDEDMVRNLLVSLLRAEGYVVLSASSGMEALELCRKHDGDIHLLMTDVVMPGISGRELAEQLAERGNKMKVLYMSGYTDDAIVHHGVLDAGTAFLQKPFTPRGVARKVREVLDSNDPIVP